MGSVVTLRAASKIRVAPKLGLVCTSNSWDEAWCVYGYPLRHGRPYLIYVPEVTSIGGKEASSKLSFATFKARASLPQT